VGSSLGLQPVEKMVDAVFGHIDLGDPRREKRLQQVARACIQSPGVSFGQRFGSPKETKGAYRLLENEQIAGRDLLDALEESGGQACAGRERIFAVQDTTELDFSHRQTIEGMGPLHTQANPGQGLLLHTTLALDERGSPLGYVGISLWARDPEEMGKRSQRRQKPIEEKESYKWIEGIERAQQSIETHGLAEEPSPAIIHVMDREGDIFEVFEKVYACGHGVVVRASRNRNVASQEGYLWETLQAQPVGGKTALPIPAKPGRAARTALLEIRWGQVTLQPPRTRQKGKVPVAVSAVWVSEPNPPKDGKPLEWMLLTTEPVESWEEVLEIVQVYRHRWRVEELHLILKSGCRMEQGQFGSREAIEKMLSLNLLAALRILTLRYVAESQPDCAADEVLNETEQEALRIYVRHRFGQMLGARMTVAEVRQWIGRIGGHLGRRGDGPPGVRTLWRGWRDFQLILSMHIALHPT